MRLKLVAGNWKMHGLRATNRALLDGVIAGIGDAPGVERMPIAYGTPHA